MEASLDLSRWREAPKGVGYRRWTIVITGLRHLLRVRSFIVLTVAAWVAGLVVAAFGFLFTQSVATDGWLQSFAENLGSRAEAMVAALGGMVTLYPDICIHGVFTLAFWIHSYLGLALTLLALTLVVPQLIARDRASNALTIYLSRPLTSTDYLIGKLGIIVGVIVLLWTGPLVFGWLTSMMLAPDRDFIVYSMAAFGHALLFNAIALVALAAIALGISALTRVGRIASIVWVGFWLVTGTMAKLPSAPPWLQHASFSYDLSQVRQQVFRVDEALTIASAQLPLLDQDFTRKLAESGKKAASVDFTGALIGLAVLTAAGAAVFLRRLRSE
jgi:hypothetical protein